MFSTFLPSLLHSRCANKVSNMKIHRRFCSHCLFSPCMRINY